MPHWRREKAEVNHLFKRAHDGEPVKDDDGVIAGTISPLYYRARALRASRIHEIRVALGIEDEESVEAEAGALLAAETDHEIHNVAEMMRGYIEALNKSKG